MVTAPAVESRERPRGIDVEDLARAIEAVERPTPAPSALPSPGRWLVWLFLKPQRFFRELAVLPLPRVVAVSAWLYGLVSVADRVETRAAATELAGRPFPAELRESWILFWLVCLAIGVVAGFLYFGPGGFWYRVRLKLCGAAAPDPAMARRVYLFSSQVYFLPALLYLVWQSLAYASPRAAAAGSDAGFLLVYAALFGSVYVSFRGATTAFPLRPWPARIWFLLLPALVYLVMLGVAVGGALRSGALLEPAPRVAEAQWIERPGFRVAYPGNWVIDTSDPDYDPDYEFSIEPAIADAAVRFLVYDLPVDPAQEADLTLEGLAEAFDLRDRTELAEWGTFRGAGWDVDARIEGKPYRLRIFCHTTDSAAFEVMEVVEDGVASKLEPGLQLIRRTFELRRPPL